MARIEVNGIGLAYELIGEGERVIAITPGGRYSKDADGVPQLAVQLAAGGYRVLTWDRPNAGEADFCFEGPSESVLCADAFAGLIRKLELGPVFMVGASAGARCSLLTALRHPDTAKGLFLYWISGGPIGVTVLSMTYCGVSGAAAARGGMARAAKLQIFEEPLERNPNNRERLLGMDPKVFIAVMQDWVQAGFPEPGAPMPALKPEDFAKLKLPVMVLRSGPDDIHHPRATSEAVASLIPGAVIADPPWGETEWHERMEERDQGGRALFYRMPLVAPQVLAFAETVWG